MKIACKERRTNIKIKKLNVWNNFCFFNNIYGGHQMNARRERKTEFAIQVFQYKRNLLTSSHMHWLPYAMDYLLWSICFTIWIWVIYNCNKIQYQSFTLFLIFPLYQTQCSVAILTALQQYVAQYSVHQQYSAQVSHIMLLPIIHHIVKLNLCSVGLWYI